MPKAKAGIKLPLGVMPKWRHDELRASSILDAMELYAKADKAAVVEWVVELRELFLKTRGRT